MKTPNSPLHSLIGSFVAVSLGSAQAAPPDPITFETQKVVVFKDGHALIIKKGKGTTDEAGEIHSLEVPDAAVLGSFWATTPKEGALVGMRAGWRETEADDIVIEPAMDNLAILRANVGSSCTVTLSTEEGRFTGTISKVLTKETATDAKTEEGLSLNQRLYPRGRTRHRLGHRSPPLRKPSPGHTSS